MFCGGFLTGLMASYVYRHYRVQAPVWAIPARDRVGSEGRPTRAACWPKGTRGTMMEIAAAVFLTRRFWRRSSTKGSGLRSIDFERLTKALRDPGESNAYDSRQSVPLCHHDPQKLYAQQESVMAADQD
jgi:hypothetical protein